MTQLMIPDTILENSFCKECYKYLTVAPIGVHPMGGNICGRCLYGDNISSATNTLFEFTEFMEYFFPLELFCFACCNKGVFPCINRYDGCDKLFNFQEIRDHEKICTVPKTKCPSCQFEGVGSQMLQHFKLDHYQKTLIGNHNEFYLDFFKNSRQTYLYQSTRNVLFFLKLEYCKEISQISFDTLCLGTLSSAYIQFNFLYGKTNTFSMISNNLNMKKNKTYNMTMKIDNLEIFEARNLLCKFNIIFSDNQ